LIKPNMTSFTGLTYHMVKKLLH